MSEYIKGMLGTQGWKETEEMFVAAIEKCSNEKIDDKNSNEVYGSIARANRKAAHHMTVLLNRIKNAGQSNWKPTGSKILK